MYHILYGKFKCIQRQLKESNGVNIITLKRVCKPRFFSIISVLHDVSSNKQVLKLLAVNNDVQHLINNSIRSEILSIDDSFFNGTEKVLNSVSELTYSTANLESNSATVSDAVLFYIII